MDTLQLKKITKSLLSRVLHRDGGEFSRRIRHRNNVFWSSQAGRSIKAIRMSATDPLSKWQSIPYWQRLLSNKHNALEFAKMHGCRVPNVYWEGKEVNQLLSLELPEQFVVKPTIGAGCKMIFLMKNGINLMDKQAYSRAQIVDFIKAAMQKDSRLEFIVQEFVCTEQGTYEIPVDYKVYIFNGHVSLIYVINRDSPKSGTSANYDEKWNMIPDVDGVYKSAPFQKPPKCLPEIIDCAKKLSKAYETFVRIDFYATDKGAVFGEFAPTPGMGRNFNPEGEKLLVKYWDDYCAGMI